MIWREFVSVARYTGTERDSEDQGRLSDINSVHPSSNEGRRPQSH